MLDWTLAALALDLICLCVSAAAVAFLLLALGAAALWRPSPRTGSAGRAPSMCVLKPLCGAEPLLEPALRSLLDQHYGGPLRLVFGVRLADDPAASVVRRLAAERPELDIRLVCDDRVRGSNRKVANLINMERETAGELVVVSDSDTFLPPGALQALAAAAAPMDVGAATCLYFGRPARPDSRVQRFGAAYLEGWFVPSAVMHAQPGGASVGYGPLTAIKFDVLRRAGGFTALQDCLADDTELGAMARRQGLKVAFADACVETVVADPTLPQLLSHELRWARTTRALQPVGYAASIVTHPGPLPWLALALHVSPLAWGLALAIPLLRWVLCLGLRARCRYAGGRTPSPLLLLVREQVYFGVWMAGFLGRDVRWRGRRLTIRTAPASAWRRLGSVRPAPRMEVAGEA